MKTIVDFHSHILPGIDDGSASVDESIAMLKMEAEQGIHHVVATPHFYANHDSPERFLKRRNYAEALLREEMDNRPGLPKLSVGAEVYFFQGISESDILSELTIAKKRYILIEMPRAPWADHTYRELEAISVKQGITPIIAHIDRYIRPFRTFAIPERLSQMPVLVQANADFFLKKSTENMALRLLRGDKIHLLGSDCHDLHSRKPNLGSAVDLIEKRVDPQFLNRLRGYEEEILNDNGIDLLFV